MLAGSEHTLLGLQYDKIRVLQHSGKKNQHWTLCTQQ